MVYTICVFLILKNMNPETSWLLSKSCRARKLVSTFELYGVYMMYIETKWCMFVWFVCVRLCLPSFRPSPNFLSLSLSSWVTTVHGSKRLSGLIEGAKCIERNRASQPSVLSAFLLILSQNYRSNMNPVGKRVLCLFDNHL